MEPEVPTTPRTSLRSEIWPAAMSLGLGITLVAAKFIAYYLTKSAAIYSDAVENIVNVLTSGFALYAIRLAHQPADADHPYGHGKVEFLSAEFEGGMVLLAAVLIVARAAESFARQQSPSDVGLGMVITCAATLLCGGMGMFLRQRGKNTGSVTLAAEGTHLMCDAVTGAMVLAGLIAVRRFGIAIADPIAALLVAIWIIWQALALLRRAAAGLMDEQDASDAKALSTIINRHTGVSGQEPRICSYHKLRHRHSGRHLWVDFHIQVPARWNVERGHQVATSIEMEIEREMGQCSASAHVEPCVAVDCPCQQSSEPTAVTARIE